MSSASSAGTQVPVHYALSTAESFACGALAACTSVTFTNPMEVCKTRLQLDGELQAKASAKLASPASLPPGQAPLPTAPGRVYDSFSDALSKTYRYEGIRGLQRGLGAAYTYQILLNGSRLGYYEPTRLTFNRWLGVGEGNQFLPANLLAGATTGIIGASLGNPLFLVKARMQAYSPYNPTGAQHKYTSSLHALSSIVRAEGFKGLLRGLDAACLRTAMGSSVQVPSYIFSKNFLLSMGMRDGAETYLMASSFSGACVLTMMQPADTALTRMYNQSPNSIGPDGKPRGLLYKNPIDCLMKTARTEGVLGWYKGSLAHFFRIAPHTVITLVANEYFVQLYRAYRERRGRNLAL